MPKCLGIYIEDNVIKYSKVEKVKDSFKIESYNVEFYDKNNTVQTLEKIIRETISEREPISINISDELYNYFEVFASLNKKDRDKLVDVDFEYFCGEKGYNKDSLDSRIIYRNSKEDADKLKAIHISTNKESLHKRLQDFGNVRITNVMPITTSIFNLVDLGPRDENVLIVNIETQTKITTIIGGEVYHIDVLPQGMGEILDSINTIENDMKKSFECCRNTTIYTQDMQNSMAVSENEHLEDVMPTLYSIVNDVKKIAEGSIGQISKIYITGMGTAINNIDLYFQEYIPAAKVELLRPFFLDNNSSSKVPIKEIMEVNSATALAIDGLGGFGGDDNGALNFKGRAGRSGGGKKSGGGGGKGLSSDVDLSQIVDFFKGLVDPKKEMTAVDKGALRLVICLCVAVLAYSGASYMISNQIDEKQKEVENEITKINTQINVVNSYTSTINRGKTAYDDLYSQIYAIVHPEEKVTTPVEDPNGATTTPDVPQMSKNAIPNLLNRIVYVIPQQVRVTSITNPMDNHVIIEAQASKYEYLGYFRAALSTSGYLLNVKSTSGTKSGGTVVITIEGDLP